MKARKAIHAAKSKPLSSGKKVMGGMNFSSSSMMKSPDEIPSNEIIKSKHDLSNPLVNPCNGLLRR